MMILHKHHIVPRHAGGTDDPSNLVLLTVEEHAEAHRVLYEEHGRWQDHLAWKTLSGQIDRQEAIRLSQINAGREAGKKGKGRPKSQRHRLLHLGSNNHFYGKTHSVEWKSWYSSVQKERQSGAGNTRAVRIEVTDDEGTRTFGCIKDYALSKKLNVHQVQHFFREISKNENYRPRVNHPTECIISMKRV